MTTREKELELSDYLIEWANARYQLWEEFRRDESMNARNGIYLLPNGDSLMDFLNSLVGNIEDHLICETNLHVIPSCFSSIGQLLQFLNNFKSYIENNYHLLEKQFKGEDTNYVIADMARICDDIVAMVNRCQSSYLESDSVPIPYIQARRCLYDNNITGFIDIMQSLIAEISYSISKEKRSEGYFHTVFHVISSIMGLNPESEVETSDGRIDVCFECPNHIYIIEFKYSEKGNDESKIAFDQIQKKKYDQRYHIRCKPIYGIGISFSGISNNIDKYFMNTLYAPKYQQKLGITKKTNPTE